MTEKMSKLACFYVGFNGVFRGGCRVVCSRCAPLGHSSVMLTFLRETANRRLSIVAQSPEETVTIIVPASDSIFRINGIDVVHTASYLNGLSGWPHSTTNS